MQQGDILDSVCLTHYNFLECTKVFLVTDCLFICEVPIQSSLFALLSAYFVYYIKYHGGFNNFFSFLEVVLLGVTPENVSSSVTRLLTNLKGDNEK